MDADRPSLRSRLADRVRAAPYAALATAVPAVAAYLCLVAKRGCSRDGKRNTLQIEFGLLCNRDGCPVAVEVFEGNTADPSTVSVQIEKLQRRFGRLDVGWMATLPTSQTAGRDFARRTWADTRFRGCSGPHDRP